MLAAEEPDAVGVEDDSVEANLERRDELSRGGGFSLIPDWTAPWLERRVRWKEKYGLELSFWYDALCQVGLGGGEPMWASSGEIAVAGTLDLYARHRARDRRPDGRFGQFREDNPLLLKFRIRDRHRYGSRAPAALGGDLGAIWGTVDGFNNNGFEIPDLFIRQLKQAR